MQTTKPEKDRTWPHKLAALLALAFCLLLSRALLSEARLGLEIVAAYSFAIGYWIAGARIKELLRGFTREVATAVGTVIPKYTNSETEHLEFANEAQQTLESTFTPLQDLIASLKTQVMAVSRRHDLLATNLAAAVSIYDHQSKLVFCSPYVEVLTGYSLDEVHATPGGFWTSIIRAEDIERFKRALALGYSGKDVQLRCQVLHKSGMKLWLDTCMVPIFTDSGEVESVMLVSSDITTVINYQHQIEEQNQDLSDFAYMISHDLKSPLFTIKGMATALQEDYGPELKVDGQELLGHILEAAESLEKLISSVIDYSSVTIRKDAEDWVDLNSIVQSVIADQAQQIKDSNAKVEIKDILPQIQADPVRIYQMFANLISNAIKYKNPGRAPRIQVRLRASGEHTLCIEVEDNGKGIPPEKCVEVFRPYTRLHGEEVEGNGIGLACVKKIVERLGGKISVSSELEKGSVFSIVLPQSRFDVPSGVAPSVGVENLLAH